MNRKPERQKPEPLVQTLQKGQAMVSAGTSETEVFERLEITESTWKRWNSQYGGIKSDEAKRLLGLDTEKQRFEEMFAMAGLDKRILKTALEATTEPRTATRSSQSRKRLASYRSVEHSHLAVRL